MTRPFIFTVLAVIAATLPLPRAAAQRATSDRRLTYSFHVGLAHPLGTMDSLNDANVHGDIDFSYRISKTPIKGYFNLKLYGGLNQFTAEPFVTIPHERWINLSLNVQWVLPPTGSGLRPYVEAGPGMYWPKSGPSEKGWNVGAGGQIPVGVFAIEFGVDIHQIQTKPVRRFVTGQLGVLFH